MTTEQIIGLIVLVLGGGPAGIYLAVRKDKRQAPIEVRTAEAADKLTDAQTSDLFVAQAAKISAMAVARLEALERDVSQLKAQVVALTEHSRTQDRVIGTLEDVVESWTTWAAWIHEEWPTLRLRESPPDLPTIPQHKRLEDGP